MRIYNNDLMLGFLRNINEQNLIDLNKFSESFEIDKSHVEWLINDLILKGYLRKNELHCSFDCEIINCDKELSMYLELTEKGKKIIS